MGYAVASANCFDGTPAAKLKGPVTQPKKDWTLVYVGVALALLAALALLWAFLRPAAVDMRAKRLAFFEKTE